MLRIPLCCCLLNMRRDMVFSRVEALREKRLVKRCCHRCLVRIRLIWRYGSLSSIVEVIVLIRARQSCYVP